ncbi:MAG: hypothetical protein M0Z96_02390, partial [Actinomycetota bacterium]|nr:hypothetical protein [Actinomycetota bacterium]
HREGWLRYVWLDFVGADSGQIPHHAKKPWSGSPFSAYLVWISPSARADGIVGARPFPWLPVAEFKVAQSWRTAAFNEKGGGQSRPSFFLILAALNPVE